MVSSASMPRSIAPRIRPLSASISTRMKPWISERSRARATLLIGMVAARTLRPEARASSSLIPTRASGGSM